MLWSCQGSGEGNNQGDAGFLQDPHSLGYNFRQTT